MGFALGAAGSAWQRRERYAAPWRKLRVEHQGVDGATTRTRVVFENPKLPLQAVEVVKSPEGAAELARVVLRDGQELTIRYGDDGAPTLLEGSDGARALLSYHDTRARVAFVAPNGKEVAAQVVRIPVELRSALGRARTGGRGGRVLGALADDAMGWIIGEAWAREDGDDAVTVQRDVVLALDIREPAAKDVRRASAQLDASCPPFTCLPAKADVAMPGVSMVRIAVSTSTTRGALDKPANKGAVEPFKRDARQERLAAERVLPDVTAVVSVVGITALACRYVQLTWPICVTELGTSGSVAGGAVSSISRHDVDTEGRVVDERALALYYEEQAARAMDREIRIQVCVSRDGYARACTQVDGRPFAAQPMAQAQRSVELRRGIGGTLLGSFVLTQSDGGDCRFSPSPKTSGELRLSFDDQRSTVTAAMKANERGTRPDLTCSLGTANMGWSQTYNLTATQSFTQQQLRSGGKLPLRLTGSMSGAGSYSFSNCRGSGGASANCPAGKSDSYTYPVELVGDIDLDDKTGGGRIIVKNAPLNTTGTWRVPAQRTP